MMREWKKELETKYCDWNSPRFIAGGMMKVLVSKNNSERELSIKNTIKAPVV